MNVNKTSVSALVVAMLFVAGLALVQGAPSAPNSIDSRFNSTWDPSAYADQPVSASAGNITALVMSGISQTQAWQGYFGNITGTITLDDADENTFYNWSAAEPRGEIFASLNSTVTWTAVDCFNFTNNTMNRSVIEDYYNISQNDADGIDETFAQADHPSFTVGSLVFNAECPTTYVFQSDASQAANFVNVLLWNTADVGTGWIYTTIIENKTSGPGNGDLLCYNGQPCDFQLLVNEDGHAGNTATTTYYFWVELS